MKLLITTQCVDANDPALGFFVRWIEELASRSESVTVFALRVGEYKLPGNVTVVPIRLPGQGKLMSSIRFIWLCIRYQKNYDTVLVHMNPEYLVLSGFLWRLMGKGTALWYMHKSVTWSLRIAMVLVDTIFTASKESFPLPTPKLRIMGHGIEVAEFFSSEDSMVNPPAFISIGRLSQSKGYDVMLAALAALNEGVLTVYGEPGNNADSIYQSSLIEQAAKQKITERIMFAGPIKHSLVGKALTGNSLFFHASRGTGSLDKAPLEAMFSGLPVVSTSPAFKNILEPYGLYVAGDEAEFAQKVELYLQKPERERKQIGLELAAMVKSQHSLTQLIPKIVSMLPRRVSYKTHLKNMLFRSLLGIRNTLNMIHPLEEVGVLCYHSIGDSAAETTVTPQQFEHHLHLLKSNGYSIVPLSDIVSWSRGQKRIPKKSLAITFDDGYEDFMSAALPILKKNSIPTTLFVVGDTEGSRAKLQSNLPLLSKEAIKDLLSEPLIELGFHSMTHADVRTLSGTLLEKEMRPEFPMNFFAYPGGNYSAKAIETAKKLGYLAAFSIKPTQFRRGDNLYVLPRVVITRAMSDQQVLFSASRAIRWYRTLWFIFTSV